MIKIQPRTLAILCCLVPAALGFSACDVNSQVNVSSNGINSSSSASSSGDNSSAPAITWTISGSVYKAASGTVSLSVDTNYGARITSFQGNGTEVLFYNGSLNSGSAFWPSPQSAWPWSGNWPSPTNFDLIPYAAAFSNASNALVLNSLEQPALGVSIRKIITGNPSSNEITLTYGIYNDTPTNVLWAPWEITRVPNSAIVFFPKETSNYVGNSSPQFPIALETTNQFWCQNGNNYTKLFRDGAEGWIGVCYNGMLFVKKYPNLSISQFAPGESDVEVYAGGNYYEVEDQGAYTSIAPGAWFNWSVTWRCTNLPANATAAVGSSSLYQLAEALAQ